MDEDIPSSSQTLPPETPPKSRHHTLDLSNIPPTLILPAHLKPEEQREIEKKLTRHRVPLTTDVSQARVFIGKVGTKRRAEFELRSRKLKVEEVVQAKRDFSTNALGEPPTKRTKIGGTVADSIAHDGETTDDEPASSSETEDEFSGAKALTRPKSPFEVEETAPVPVLFEHAPHDEMVWVVRTDWLNECSDIDRVIPLGKHLVFKGRVVERQTVTKPRKDIKSIFSSSISKITPASQTNLATRPIGRDILDRAQSELSNEASKPKRKPYHTGGHGSRRFEGKTFASSSQQAGNVASQTARLLQQMTSDYEGEDSDIPPPPPWVKKRIKYSCQRFTPASGPNDEFIELLKKIRTARTLIDDQIGVRAYSTIIAAIAAYPYKLTHPREILRIPGCEDKAATLWVEWKNTGKLQAVSDFENDPAMQVLRLFYNIWGVGAKTARQFYYTHHWTELDDLIEHAWPTLDRVQQIGLKYYDDFLSPIPRTEVEHIASIVHQHATRLRDPRATCTLVGGHRRGKSASGDADILISHPDHSATAHLITALVASLEDAGYITHTLTLSLAGTQRSQSVLPFRSTKASGGGFDSLDKALVVWQDPDWPTRSADLAANPATRNPRLHRRVDIIVAPWRSVGCAVLGWSGGTTFQRDLRRYAKVQ
ncbi:terminal deoxynucleotidyl transferas-like protein [Polyplosphaeria fusca]|uniref:DNA polymerase n=1 Tax=Polyplosphaeria fusca TaxID=682080 RepID=A0A9P4V426_9PLEO|nr:terminal deoxynucleotidyl transferas-like protein [Polyplosphaeria fusca]